MFIDSYSKRIIAPLLMAITVLTVLLVPFNPVFASPTCEDKRANGGVPVCQSVDVNELGFKIPSLADILTFAIRALFAVAGLAALFYMLLGAFAWVTSGGDKDAITAAREKIQAAVVGMLLIVGVLAIIWTLEQVIFQRRVCLGLSCPVTLPGLIETSDGQEYCCQCADEKTGALGDSIDAFTERCLSTGKGEGLDATNPAE